MEDATASKAQHPLTLWAQRADTVLLTICLEDIQKPTIKVEDDRFFFRSKGGHEQQVYELDFKFYKEVNSSHSRQHFTSRELFLTFKKKEPGTPFWPRLLETKEKQHWLKVDFNRWKDEDDSDVEEDGSFEDMMKKMGGGIPQEEMLEGINDEAEDSDDEDLPDLE